MYVGHVGQELLFVEGPFGHVHEVGRVLVAALGQGRGGREPSGVAADGLVDRELVDLLHVAGQSAGLLHGQGRVSRRAGVSRCVVGGVEIVVDRLGHADAAKLVALPGREVSDAMDRIHRVVAADHEDSVDVVPL